MSIKTLLSAGTVAVGLSLAAAEGIQTAAGGEMLVDLDAAAFVDVLEAGASVVTWPNAGSEPDFAWVRTGETAANPLFRMNGDVPVVRFVGSATGVLTNGVPTPASLLGNQAWTVEAWLFSDTQKTDARDFLSLTANDGLEDNNYTCAEFRFDQQNTVAVEHYGLQAAWGRHTPDDTRYRPVTNKWYNITVTHEASGYERVYVNGHIASVRNATLALSEVESFLVVAGNYDRDAEEGAHWRRYLVGDISRLRVQSGALTTAQVLNNFNAEKGTFGLAAETPDPVWTAGGGWLNDNPYVQDANLVLEGDQPLVFDNGASNTLHFVTVNAAQGTGLVIDNNTLVVVEPGNDRLDLGNLAGGTFTARIPSGTLATPGNSITLGMYNRGIMEIGGRDDAVAQVLCGSSFRVGEQADGQAELTVGRNGSLVTAKDFYIADVNANPGTVTVEAGGRIQAGTTLRMYEGEMTVKTGGEVSVGTTLNLYRDTHLVVEAGATLSVTGSVYLANEVGPSVLDVYGTLNNDTVGGTTTLYVTGTAEGGVGTFNLHPGAVANLQAMRTQDDVATTTGTFNMDGATVRTCRRGRTWLVPPLVTFNVKNEVTFEVNPDPADETAQVVAKIGATINDLTEDGVATIVKTGTGTLQLTNNGTVPPSAISSRFVVREGRLAIATAEVFPAAFDGSFLLDGGEIAADFAGGAAMVLARLEPASKGRLVLTANNAQDNLDLSAYPDVEVVTEGSFTYTGRYTPYGNKYVFHPANGEMVFAGDIGDVGGVPASVEIYGATDADGVTLSGVNDGMTGSISVFKGILGIAGTTDAAGSATTKLYLAEGTSLKLDARVGKTFLATRLDPASKPAAILLTEQSAGCDIDLSKFPGCRLGPGTTNAVVHMGAILPDADNVYLLGGGNVGYWRTAFRGLTPAPLVDVGGTPARVQVGRSGLINLSNAANTYSGGTEVTDGAALFLSGDGLGAVPEAFDEDNLYLNGGVVRSGPDTANFALAPTRGVKVGPAGAALHPWGNSHMDIQGGLTGGGALAITDQGHLAFSGAHNTFNGTVTASRAETVLTIGSEENFSWASEGGISTPGTLVLQTPVDATFNDAVSGTGSLVKRGAGTLTLTKDQAYTGTTAVEGGTLVLANGASLAGSSAFRNDGEVVFSSLDALGLGTIAGSGTFTLIEGGNMQLDGSRISGEPNFKVSKDANLEITSPDISARAEITAADGSSLTLGAAAPEAADGFGGFSLNGSAEMTEDGRLRLTPSAPGVYGSAFLGTRVKITGSWEAEIVYELGAHGAISKTEDCGMGFVLHNNVDGKTALGTEPGTAGVGCNFGTVEGAVMRLFDNNTVQDFYGQFANYATTGAIKASEGHPVTIKLIYDGSQLFCLYTDTVNGNVRGIDTGNKTRAVNLKEALGGEYAWIGFGAFSGNETQAEQFIKSFTFTRKPEPSGDVDGFTEDDWALVQKAAFADLDDGTRAIQLTTLEKDVRGAAWYANPVRVDRPFTASFKYRVTENDPTGPGYGFAVILQNSRSKDAKYDGIKAYGEKGDMYGWAYASATANGAKTNAVGYVVHTYNGQSNQKFREVLHNSILDVPSETAGSGLTMWPLADGSDTQFHFRWDMTNLTITAVREGVVEHSLTQAFDVESLVDGRQAFFGFTGATGGRKSVQFIHDFHFVYDAEEDDDAPSTYANRFVVEGETQLTLGIGTVGFSNMELLDGASLKPVSEGSASVLNLKGPTVKGDARVASGEHVPVFLSGTIAYTDAKGTLTLVGDVKKKGEKIVIDLAEVQGVHKLIDMSGMTTPLTLDDFELADGVPQPLKMDIQGGVLRVWRDNATVLIFR